MSTHVITNPFTCNGVIFEEGETGNPYYDKWAYEYQMAYAAGELLLDISIAKLLVGDPADVADLSLALSSMLSGFGFTLIVALLVFEVRTYRTARRQAFQPNSFLRNNLVNRAFIYKVI